MLLSGQKRGDVLWREVWVLFSRHCVGCVGELNTDEERGAGLSVEDEDVEKVGGGRSIRLSFYY